MNAPTRGAAVAALLQQLLRKIDAPRGAVPEGGWNEVIHSIEKK